MSLHAPGLKKRAKQLRQNPTPEETLLWGKLRNKNLGGAKFRRQHPILEYILDFYCVRAKLAVEVDGGYHDPFHDKARDGHLASYGILTLRFSNEQVTREMGTVLKIIRETYIQRCIEAIDKRHEK